MDQRPTDGRDGAKLELAGKVAVITGGASGIGLALARRFASEGMKLVLADVEAEALDTAARSLAEEHGKDNVLAVPTDVRHPEAVDALAAATFERFETAHIVCNNAGVAVGGLSWTVPPDRWRWIVEVNLLGVVHGIQAFVPRLVEQNEGHVVNTASIAGLATAPAMGPYAATKHAVVALTESLYFDLQVSGSDVGTSVLCPAWVRTRIADGERNRPADVSAMETAIVAGAGSARQFIHSLVDNGIEPTEVADTVLDAIHARRFWVLTHPTWVGAARKRWEAIESQAPPVWWGGWWVG
jgi:NAD(P)-dependent dehydrogenase (short-subunit alcohol dehydrogenase family)